METVMLPTRLRAAILAREPEIVQALVEHRDFKSEDGIGVVHLAASMSSEEVLLKLAMRGLPIDDANKLGIRPVHLAAWTGRLKNLSMLLGGGADVDKPDHGGRSPLHYAARYGAGGAIDVLLRAGARLSLDHQGRDPLHNACLEAHTEWLSGLVRLGADPNRIDKEGSSAMVAQAMGNHFRSVVVLSSLGGDPDRKDALGHTAAKVLQMVGRGDVATCAREEYADQQKRERQYLLETERASWAEEREQARDW